MKKIIITKTEEIVVEDPQQALQNLHRTLQDIEEKRKNLKKLEKEVKKNIAIIWKEISAFVVKVNAEWKVVSESVEDWIDIDVTKGDVIAFNETDAKNICDAKENEFRMIQELEKQKQLEESQSEEDIEELEKPIEENTKKV